MSERLKAPFPWFGGKSRAADLIWSRLGDVPNYVEPFAGSLAVLLNRPTIPSNEIVNDLDCYVANAWRATKLAPEEVAEFSDWPVNEADLHARHRWLHKQTEFRKRMEHEPEFYDARIAGWWIWGLSCWIGDNFCRPTKQDALPHLTGGKGVARQVPHLTGGKGDRGVNARSLRNGDSPSPAPDGRSGRGSQSQNISIQTPRLTGSNGVTAQAQNLADWFSALALRMRFTKVCCGDWKRVCTKASTWGQGLTGILLDPPYDTDGHDDVYGEMSRGVSGAVRDWAIENGSHPLLRIALCGYESEHAMPAEWECVEWKASGGYGNQSDDNENRHRERVWFSPACLKDNQRELFAPNENRL